MQFYKERDFGSLISDTVDFFKQYGRNFFKNYLMINGGVVVLLVLVLVIGYGDFLRHLLDGNIDGGSFLFGRYFEQNQTMLLIVSILSVLLIILLSVICYSFPVLYMKKVAETGRNDLSVSEMFEVIKANGWRFLQFFLGTTLIIGPIFVVSFLLSGLLIFLLIGFLMLMILVPVMMNLVNFTLFQMYNSNDGYFSALAAAFRFQFSKNFWKFTGSTLLVGIIIQMMAGIVMIIPMIFLYVSVLTGSNAYEMDPLKSPLSIVNLVIFVTYLISMLCTVILMNIQYVNAGIMYYSSRSDLRRREMLAEIDTIGSLEK